jgi:uncharacterized protein
VSVTLRALEGRFAVCRLGPDVGWPWWATRSRELLSITRTEHETSIVCEEELVPESETSERSFRAFAVVGPIPFSATGVLASLAEPLRRVEISLFPLGTYDTDYLLIKATDAESAVSAWRDAGHVVVDRPR